VRPQGLGSRKSKPEQRSHQSRKNAHQRRPWKLPPPLLLNPHKIPHLTLDCFRRDYIMAVGILQVGARLSSALRVNALRISILSVGIPSVSLLRRDVLCSIVSH